MACDWLLLWGKHAFMVKHASRLAVSWTFFFARNRPIQSHLITVCCCIYACWYVLLWYFYLIEYQTVIQYLATEEFYCVELTIIQSLVRSPLFPLWDFWNFVNILRVISTSRLRISTKMKWFEWENPFRFHYFFSLFSVFSNHLMSVTMSAIL